MESTIKLKPLVSVIIPVYNGEETISSAVYSVQKQKYSNVEIIVVDNGSTDKTKLIVNRISEIDKRIKLFESNKGRSNARNKGLAHASGKYINFLDADDMFTKEHIIRSVNFLESNTNYFAYAEGAEFTSKNGIIPQKLNEKKSTDLNITNPFEISAVTFRNVGIVNFVDNLEHNEDWLFWIHNLKNKEVMTRFDLIGEQKSITGKNTMLDLDNMIGSELIVVTLGKISRTLKKQIKLMFMFARSTYSEDELFKKKVMHKYKLAYILVYIGNHTPFVNKQIEKQIQKNITRLHKKMIY